MRDVGNQTGSVAGTLQPLIAGRSDSTVSPRFSGWPVRRGIADHLLHRRLASQAQIASGLLSRPTPSLIGVEVRAVARQVHKTHLQLRGPQIVLHRLATMGWGIIPDDLHRSRVPVPQSHQEGNRGSAVAVTLQFYPFHLAGLHTNRRIIARLLTIPRAGRVHQSLLPPQHPLAP